MELRRNGYRGLGRRRFIMNKEELVKEISKKSKVSQKAAAAILSATLDTIEKTVSKGKKVTLVGFGTFESRKRAARTGRNPQTGATLKIAAKKVVRELLEPVETLKQVLL